MSYATSAQMLTYVQIFRPDITSVSAVSNTVSTVTVDVHTNATAAVNQALMDYYIDPTTALTDYFNFLLFAEVCFYLDECSRLGIIEQRTGVLQKEEMGKIKRSYASSAPMFFFSQGASKPFMELLATETYRMKAYDFVRSYSVIAAKKTNDLTESTKGYWKIWGVSQTDRSPRGHNSDDNEWGIV
jgi:hypothetical protein